MFARRLGVLVSSLCLLLQLATFAAEPRAGADRRYQVDSAGSRIFVKVGSATLIGHEHGVEARLKSGQLALGGPGELVFDMGSFTADTAESRKRAGLAAGKISASDAKEVTKTMLGAEVLNVASFPTATFRMAAVTPLDQQPAGAPGTYQLAGDLTLHGTKRSLQLPAKLDCAQQQGQMRLSGTFTIKQKDFGIQPYSTAAGIVRVADELEITGDLILIPAQE
jgi:polyisoprenoid-binding protein YceI